MTYDQWREESPEDERERLETPARKRAARQQYLEDNADEINEERRERAAEREIEPWGWED